MGKESFKLEGLYRVKCVILYGSALTFNSFFGLFLIHCENSDSNGYYLTVNVPDERRELIFFMRKKNSI